MSIIVTVGVGVAATMAVGYIGRKGWLAFHRAVGITPGKMTYVELTQLPPPPMLQLSLANSQLQGLPIVIMEQLQRIDSKADILQQWRSERIEAGQTPEISEDEFVVSKLLQTRLPELLDSYQQLLRHERRLQQVATGPGPLQGKSSNAKSSQTQLSQQDLSQQQAQALQLVMELLLNIEDRLDGLLQGCQNDALQQLQVMQRYMQQRQD
ncbi:hypothetical protein [Psychrobacter sp. FDAARGOS_221]|uniref:hypothetical protein n=1 Tax=Psychrobacter sp. FDAARGOS_221 TaxID=1975705 RepID=UPI000BB541CA|nr:hypothetical protein [Psychrobacter sp. FDAARGOS_221]PNK61214.1 hypothetical protein A6J60_010250 [Psychrobacter sp. FDAARGOS_221]